MQVWTRQGIRLYRRSSSQRAPRLKSLAIVAHSDDAEIVAPKALIDLWERNEAFGVVVVNDGVGRPRAPAYEGYTDPEMTDLRAREQFAAARAGGYELALMLNYPSSTTKGVRNAALVDELAEVIGETEAETIYGHCCYDGHPSHIAVLQHALWAVEQSNHKPSAFFGGEVWGPLDRLPGEFLVRWDLTGHERKLKELLAYFASQNAIKSYDEAVMARRRALAKLNDPHVTLEATAVHLGIDLTAVMRGELTLRQFMSRCDEQELAERLARFAE